MVSPAALHSAEAMVRFATATESSSRMQVLVVLAQARWAFETALAELHSLLVLMASEIAAFVQVCRSPPPGQLPTLTQPSSDDGTIGSGPRE